MIKTFDSLPIALEVKLVENGAVFEPNENAFGEKVHVDGNLITG